jgi:outer membrane receptor protein involved in Fe transport
MRKIRSSTALRRATLSVALSMCVASVAFAQSNASGTIFGTGQPGATVVIENTETGFAREISVDSNGRYRVPQLPVGNYRVTLRSDGQNVASQENVSVRLGAGSEVSFASGRSADAQNLDAVIVTASSASPIDVSTTDTRVVFTAEQLQKISVANNIEALALLTPGVVQGDSRYGNVQSFGGSAASENAFYINGYAVTNPLTNLGSTTLPFNGISQYQAFIGGYGAEFGRATGGVVNIITQRGTNEWKGGVMATWSPKGQRSTQRDILYPDNGTANDGLLYQKLSDRTVDEKMYGAYVGGPIIKDRLFVYAAGEFTDRSVDTVNVRGTAADTTAQDISVEIPRWLVKVDWNITDNHLLELTGVSDVTKDSRDYFRFPYTGADALQKGNTKNGGYYYEDGGELYIAKYTGYLTDNLTVSALYGEQEQVHIATPWGYNPALVHVSDSRPGVPVTGQQPYSQLDVADAYDKTSGGRFDLDWRVGSHSLRLGYDRQDSESRAGEATSGPGYRWVYNTVGANPGITTIPGSGGAAVPGGNGDYVQRYVYANGGTFEVKQYAYYLEDRWQVNDRWLVTLGLRNENFENYNADGIIYVEQKDQWAPRLGVAWDVNGDSSLKLFANAGRYHLAMPNNVARRAAAGSLYTIEYFGFTGINPTTGEPTGLTPLGNGPYSSNQEYGSAPNPLTVAAKDLKSHFQDEFVLGFEKTLGDSHNFGARYVYRDLKSAIDDVCDFRPARDWGLANGYSLEDSEALGDSLNHCRLFNPGESNTFTLEDASGNLVEVPISAAAMGFPKLKRIYQGVDVFLERPFDGTWYYRVDYTWSKNYGNAEGQLKSDVGQMDVSMTMDWDHPELMEGAYGNLPNDRRHYIKAYGFLQYNPEWRFSATFTANSGRPKNCTGIYNGDSLAVNDEFRDAVEYSGPYYYFCDGQPSTRGSAGRLPWSAKLDVGVAYLPAFAKEKLQFAVDVFNVTNSQPVQNVVEYGEIGAPGNPYHSTYRALSYQAPRSVRFSVRYDF